MKPGGFGERLKAAANSRLGRLGIGTILAVVLMGFFFHGVDWGALVRALRGAHVWPLIGVLAATLAAYWARSWRWGYLLAPLARVKQADLFSATMVGFGASLVVPRSGELLRPWLVSRRHPLSTSAGFATIIIERLIDLITVLALFALYLFVLPQPAAQVENRWMNLLQAGGAAAGVVAFGVLGFLLALHANADGVVAGVERLMRRFPRWLAGPVGRLLRSFSAGLAVLRAPAPQLAVIGLQSMAVWLVSAYGYHLIHAAFSIDLPFHTTFLLIAFLVVGESIPTPGFVGGFHAFYLLALSEVYGIDQATAVAAAITAHLLTNLPILLIGLALLGREGLSLGRAIEMTQEGAKAKGWQR